MTSPRLLRLPSIGLACLTLATLALANPPALHLAQGTMAGEPRHDSVLLQTRLTAAAHLVDGELPGAPGWVRFEYSASADFRDAQHTPWLEATAANDFVVRTRVERLAPGRDYFYRAQFGKERTPASTGETGRFRTLPARDAAAPVRFVMLTCMHYARFFGHMADAPARDLPDADRALGYPALDLVRTLGPDFWISNGDNVYYDHPKTGQATEPAGMRRKWHEQAMLPRLRALNGALPAFYLKDDHDYRYDDADLTGERRPSPADGIRIFREQTPILPLNDDTTPTYRTVRVGRDLQLWFLEGRDYRSPNRTPDGPGKSLWGATQLAWLQQTLERSDAAFKIVVSPTPLVGPDDARKRDNHTNQGGFRHEGDAFFAWLTAKRFDPQRLLFLTGDRHWKYHAIHPSGFHEWASGAIIHENARAGRLPGDPQSTDPDATIRQLHCDRKPDGGFLSVEVDRDGGVPRARLSLHNERGEVVHSQRYPAP